MVLTDEVRDLFKVVRTRLGAPARPIPLEDDQMCDLMDSVMGDYAEKVQNYIIESQWINLMGHSGFTNASDLAYALSLKVLDWSKDWSYWFSKEVGLQQRGPWELKKDFFQVEAGKQVYMIPGGREINRVMYCTPSTSKVAMYGASNLMGGFGMGAPYAQIPGTFGGLNGFYIGSAYDTYLLASDLRIKNQLFRGDLTYKVTAGPGGTHLVHLMSTPGSPNAFGGLALDDASFGWNRYAGCYVWYTYYDMSNASEEDIEQCRIDHADELLLGPHQVPLAKLYYEALNPMAQNTVKNLLYAECALWLGKVMGYYGGRVSIPNAELQLGYSMYADEGKSEREKALTELKEWLAKLLPWVQMENQAKMAEHLNNSLKYKAFPHPIIIA